jgi:hypothetical protein
MSILAKPSRLQRPLGVLVRKHIHLSKAEDDVVVRGIVVRPVLQMAPYRRVFQLELQHTVLQLHSSLVGERHGEDWETCETRKTR